MGLTTNPIRVEWGGKTKAGRKGLALTWEIIKVPSLATEIGIGRKARRGREEDGWEGGREQEVVKTRKAPPPIPIFSNCRLERSHKLRLLRVQEDTSCDILFLLPFLGKPHSNNFHNQACLYRFDSNLATAFW